MPINCLNLAAVKANPQPWFLANNMDYQVMRLVREGHSAGKDLVGHDADLTNSETFQLLAKAGAFSMPHVDRHGVMTVVHVEEGFKDWLIFPPLSEEEQAEFARGENYCPNYRPMNLRLRPGDTLILPPSRLHAVFSPTDVLMTGNMFWDSREVLRILKQSNLERLNPELSNEDPAQEFPVKMKAILDLWERQCGPWTWGSRQELEAARGVFQVSCYTI
ncbi:hypothetical protein PV08_12107 [Exophiala spinifera]|uniref:JmjC domain-containing protein n=1 Tax=Exophiala spinifera TaxID=91928 RepID=A0A0D1Z9J5_9EURO|nr:uncharacterized protein PV08_12107 [Exophiala spinifera]KIW09642.1 hypothetical protein PV08_12107 [Exophiala spinifera]